MIRGTTSSGGLEKHSQDAITSRTDDSCLIVGCDGILFAVEGKLDSRKIIV